MDIVISLFFVLLGFAIAGLVSFTLLLLVAPLFAAAGIFVNKPIGLEKSGFHLFTKLSPGQVKIIVRGKRPVRMIMNTAGKKFARSIPGQSPVERDSSDYWKIKDGTSEDPTLDINPLLRAWAKFVYETTGAIFTGIYPFQRVYEYELERTKVQRNEDGTIHGQEKGSNLVLIVKKDVSDHFRTRQFLYPMHITGAETKDKIPLDVVGVAEMQVENPHLAAYGTDRWDQAAINLVTDKITSETKQMTLDQALTAENAVEAQRINTAVRGIVASQLLFGIKINAFRVLEINPDLDLESLKKLQSEAIAKQVAKATIVDGKARADVIREINKANAEGGAQAIATMQAEAFVRAADAVGKSGGTAFLSPQGNSGSSADPIQAAILAELKKLNSKQQPPGVPNE
jgi:hypothetical protein